MTAGLLLSGQLVATPGVTVIPPASHGGPAWNLLDPGDFMARQSPLQIVTPHTTGGLWPQVVIPGAGPSGHARQILDMWSGRDGGQGRAQHSGAQITVDFDGLAYCAADIARCAAYNATAINARNLGIEMCTRPDGSIYQATLDATARLIALLVWSGIPGSGLLPIPAQSPRAPYRNAPLRRLELDGKATSGSDVYGVIGHRWQTSQRGYGDPGNRIEEMLVELYGFELVDYDASQDIELGKARQRTLNAADLAAGVSPTWRPLLVDGLVGAASIAAAKRQGYAGWGAVNGESPLQA